MISARHLLVLAAAFLLSQTASADEHHPIMTSKYWVNLGVFFAARDFSASANGGDKIDFSPGVGKKDAPELFLGEIGWQFGEKWALGVQQFSSKRVTGKTLQETIVWQDLTFDVGVDIRAQSEVSILRMVMSRQFRDKGPHSLRLVAGLHYFDASASLAGEAAIGGLGTEFREARASASGPLPNIGAWYRYSPSDRWLMSARLDWLSAKVGNIRGGFWNIAAGANYRLSEHVGVGLAYQLFELDGQLYEDRWRGQLKTRFSGPNLYISAFW